MNKLPYVVQYLIHAAEFSGRPLQRRATFWLSFLIALLCLCGCDVSKDSTRAEVELYKCNAAQLDLVKKEVEICKETGYLNSYCFLQAKKTQCEKISTKQNTTEQ